MGLKPLARSVTSLTVGGRVYKNLCDVPGICCHHSTASPSSSKIKRPSSIIRYPPHNAHSYAIFPHPALALFPPCSLLKQKCVASSSQLLTIPHRHPHRFSADSKNQFSQHAQPQPLLLEPLGRAVGSLLDLQPLHARKQFDILPSAMRQLWAYEMWVLSNISALRSWTLWEKRSRRNKRHRGGKEIQGVYDMQGRILTKGGRVAGYLDVECRLSSCC